MPRPVYELSDEQITQKANALIYRLRLGGKITSYEDSLLRTCLGRYEHGKSRIESTERWAKEAFDENKRLIALLKERWEAGWRGSDDNAGR
jgi:hypothetical protein